MQCFVPTLVGATTNIGKITLLKEAFFPAPPPATLADIPLSTYPPPVPCVTEITIRQVHHAVAIMAPDKAPGPDEIPNRVIEKALPHIA